MKNTTLLRLILFVFCTSSHNMLLSQEIRLGLYTLQYPRNEMAAYQMEALHTKLRGWLNSDGMASADVYAPFGVKPSLSFGSPRIVDAGMKKMTVVEAELIMSLQQRDGNPSFASYTKKFTASGNDATAAKNELLSKIPGNDAGFTAFLKQNLPKIDGYYLAHCSEIKKDAESLASTGKYEQALGRLANMPTNIPCYEEVKPLIQTYYQTERDNICSWILMRAKSAATSKDYASAVQLMGKIDPASACFQEAEKFLGQLQTRVDADYAAEMTTLKAYYEAKAKTDAQQQIIIVQEHLMARHY